MGPAASATRSRTKKPSEPEWTFGDRLRKARMVAGLRAEEVASKVGVSGAAVSNWEKGIYLPKNVFDVAKSYEKLTGVSADWLLTGHNTGMPCFSPSDLLSNHARVVAAA